jgi:arginyl-tRNA synthetase
MIKDGIREKIRRAILVLHERGLLACKDTNLPDATSVVATKDKNHGDFATNIALLLAKAEGKQPFLIANMLKDELLKNAHDFFVRVDVAGPGFINMFLTDEAVSSVMAHIAASGEAYGRTTMPSPKKALIEFVSANPTGGLHLGHARGAFVGDALARLLSAAGFLVTKEYYVNDAGNQIHTLARTIHKRYRELFGETVEILPGEYPADYVKDIAKALKNLHGDRWLNKSEDEWLEPLTRFGVEYNLNIIRRSLDAADVEIDRWFYEQSLHDSGALDDVIAAYQSRHMLYDAKSAHDSGEKIRREESKAAKYAHLQEGGLFLKTTQFGDTEDRIVKRRDGRFVYLTADLAYHHQKFLRGYDVIIDVFGGDHAGHIGRIKAGMAALGHDITRLKFVVVQMMRLIKGGKEVKFSKRAGEVVGLDDLIQEVGKDVARFVFLMRSTSTQFDLDLDLIAESSSDNPVFYVQYGHARMATILARAAREGLIITAENAASVDGTILVLPEERDLLLKASELGDVVKEAAVVLEPHRLIYFCQDLIKAFHSYFTKYRHTERIISDDAHKTMARLCLVFVLKQTIHNALSFIGVSAPERMDLAVDDKD